MARPWILLAVKCCFLGDRNWVRAMYGVSGPTRRLLVVMGIPGLGDSSHNYKDI